MAEFRKEARPCLRRGRFFDESAQRRRQEFTPRSGPRQGQVGGELIAGCAHFAVSPARQGQGPADLARQGQGGGQILGIHRRARVGDELQRRPLFLSVDDQSHLVAAGRRERRPAATIGVSPPATAAIE